MSVYVYRGLRRVRIRGEEKVTKWNLKRRQRSRKTEWKKGERGEGERERVSE